MNKQKKTPIQQTILRNPDITKQGLQGQWGQLIHQPLSQISDAPLVLVIDALDECGGERRVRLSLHLLSQSNYLGSIRMKIFVASRPETPTQLGCGCMSSAAHRGFALRKVLSA